MVHSVLFVCLGNICRSPLAEGVFRAEAERAGHSDNFLIDSAGTGAWHAGDPPDPRSIAKAADHGINISAQRARQVRQADFRDFDLILAMDMDNLQTLRDRQIASAANLRLLLNEPPQNVPDPYYGGPEGFEEVYQLVKNGCQKLLAELRMSQ